MHKMRTFIESYLHFMKNCIRPHYEKLKPLKSGFIENLIFENNRDPCEAENRATHAMGTAVEDLMPGGRENRPSWASSPEDLGPASRTALRNVTSLQQGEPVPGVDSQRLY